MIPIHLMRPLFLGGVGALAILPICALANSGDRQTIKVESLDDTLKIDGILSDREWQSVVEYGPFLEKDGGSKDIAKTYIRVGQTEDALCFAIRCEEPGERGFETAPRFLNDKVWEDNGIEIFLQPPNSEGYGHIAVNFEGAKFYQLLGGEVEGHTWSPLVYYKCRKNGSGWTAEIMIPFSSIPGARNGEWRFNVCRNRHIEGGMEYSALSPTYGSFQSPAAFVSLNGLRVPGGLRQGAMPTPRAERTSQGIRVNFPKSTENGKTHEVVFEDPSGRLVAGVPVEGEYPTLINLPASDAAAFCRIVVRDTNGKIVRVTNAAPVKDWKPVKITSRQPFYSFETEAAFEWTMDGDLKDSLESLTFEVSDGRKIVVTEKAKPETSGSWMLPLKDLSPGPYDVTLVGTIRSEAPLRSDPVRIEKRPLDENRTVVRWRKDGLLTVNDAPFFPLCLYRVPVDQWGTWLPGTGFNTVHAFQVGTARHRKTESGSIEWTTSLEEIERDMDRAAELNLKVVLDIGTYVKDIFKIMPGEEDGRRLREIVSRFRDHPALLGYYLIDEPYERNFGPAQEAREIIRELDPFHPTIAPSLGRRFYYEPTARLADIFMISRYPVPYLPVSDVGRQLDAARQVAGEDQPIWFVVQTVGLRGNETLPTVEQTRCMAYQALVRGVRGLFFFSWVGDQPRQSAALASASPEYWQALKALTVEIQELMPAWLAKQVPVDVTEMLESVDCAVFAQDDGRTWIMAVNKDDQIVEVEIVGDSSMSSAGESLGDKPFDAKEGKLRFTLKPYDVMVWEGEWRTNGFRAKSVVDTKGGPSTGKFRSDTIRFDGDGMGWIFDEGVELVSTAKRPGEGYIRMSSPQGGSYVRSALQKVTGGHEYGITFSCAVSAEASGATVDASVEWLDSGGNVMKRDTLVGPDERTAKKFDWDTMGKNLIAPEDATSLRIVLGTKNNTGVVQYDAVRIVCFSEPRSAQ